MKKSNKAVEKEKTLSMPLSAMKSFIGKVPANQKKEQPSLISASKKKKSR